MTPTHKERLLADILAALLRIEALMQREKVADTATDYWVKRLSQPVPLPNADVSKLPGIKRVIGDPPHAFIGSPPGMPDPPIAPVRPQTTWDSRTTCGGNYPEIPDSSIAPVRPQTVWSSLPTSCADKANAPSLNQGRFMHGGWIYERGFSMVGP